MFDITLQAFTMDVMPVPQNSSFIVQYQVGIIVPGPPGPNGEPRGQGLLPVGAVKIPVGYNMAKEFIEEFQKVVDEMEPPKPPSKLEVVSDAGAATAAAAQAVQVEREMRGGPPVYD